MTTYEYVNADGDSAVDEISEIIDPSGLTTKFGYTGSRITSITDIAGRDTILGYDGSGRLTSITSPDPDGAGAQTATVVTFGYDSSTGLITSYTDGDNKTTTLEYYANRTLKKRIFPDSSFEQFGSSLNGAVVDTSGGEGSLLNPAILFPTDEVTGYYTDELSHTTYFSSDRFGAKTRIEDPLGNVTVYERDSEGRPTRLTEPDPDGGGPLPAAVTEFSYDTLGNVTLIEYPDGTSESWTYNATFSRPTSYTDRRGNSTLYTVSFTTGLVFKIQQVIGQVDGVGNSETDDVVTSFVYTSAPWVSSDPPAGLVSTMTDPLGRITSFDYDVHGNVTRITYADGTADEAYVEFEYDSAFNVAAFIDELGRRTEYDYDALNRLVTLTLADPDGVGSLTSPVYAYEYNKRNLVTKETDPLGRETTYTYSDRGDLETVTRPDHDSNSVLTVDTYSYDLARRLIEITDPLGRATAIGYDIGNRQTDVTLPDPDGVGSSPASPTVSAPSTSLGVIGF